MSSFNRVRLADGTELSIAEWLHFPRYSTIEFASTASVDLRAFTYVQGQTVPYVGTTARTSDERDTNMSRPGKMNQDEAMVVHAITYEAIALTDGASGSPSTTPSPAPVIKGTNLRRLQRDAVIQLTVAPLDKPQVEVPFSWLAQSVGAVAYASGALDFNYGTAGPVSAKNQRPLKLPVYIGGFGEHARVGNSQRFHLRFYNARGGAFTGLDQNIRLRFYLDGLFKRPG